MYHFKLLGTDHRELWENREALEKYLQRLKELMEMDEPKSPQDGTGKGEEAEKNLPE